MQDGRLSQARLLRPDSKSRSRHAPGRRQSDEAQKKVVSQRPVGTTWKRDVIYTRTSVPLPTGISAFRHEIYQAPESWAKAAYPHLVFYRAHDKGTHFAAWEQPQLLTEDMRETFRSVR